MRDSQIFRQYEIRIDISVVSVSPFRQRDFTTICVYDYLVLLLCYVGCVCVFVCLL